MIVYILMVLLSMLFCYFYERSDTKLKKRIFSILSFLPFFIVSGFRYGVGTDYLFRYAPDYLIIYEGGDVPNLEFIVKLIIRICTSFTRDYTIFFLITSFIINALVFWGIYRYSKKPILSILIYFINSTFFLSLNLVRQYISSSFLFLAFLIYMFDNKNKKVLINSMILIVIACFFHTAAVLFIPIIFLNNKKNSNLILIVFSIIILIFGDSIVNYLLTLFTNLKFANFQKYSIYVNYGGNLPLSSLIVELAIYIYFSYIYSKLDKSNKNTLKTANLFINIQWFVLLFIVSCSINELFIRLSSTLTIFQIISLPYFYNLSLNDKKLGFIFKKAFILIILLFVSRLIYSVPIKGSIGVLPYKTIYDRPQDIYSEINYIEYQYNRR